MRESLQALLAEAIDYAGLFPPAKLPLEWALRNYAGYLSHPEGWMLGRFICPASRLPELAPFAEKMFSEDAPCTLSVLGRGGETVEGFTSNLRADLHDILSLEDRFGELLIAEAIEVRLPAEVLDAEGPGKMVALIEDIRKLMEGDGIPDLELFFEVPLRTNWHAEVENAVAALQTFVDVEDCPPPGVKLRCGGLEASAFPSAEQVAHVIEEAAGDQVPLKFTAGLHHPIRRYDDGVKCDMHGFLNVLVGSVLANVHGVDSTTRSILEERGPAAFSFDDKQLIWNGRAVSLSKIRTVRQRVGLSFGSCSFDEPHDDLKALGLL